MRNTQNQIWAATIHYDELHDDFQIKYFTNDPNMEEKLPQTIEKWRENFADYKVIF